MTAFRRVPTVGFLAIAALVAVGIATAPPSSARVPADEPFHAPADFTLGLSLTLPGGGDAWASSPALPYSAHSITTYVKTEKQEEAEAAVDVLVKLATLSKGKRLLTCAIMALNGNALVQQMSSTGSPANALALLQVTRNHVSMCFEIVRLLASIGELQSPQIGTRSSECPQTSVMVPVTTTPAGISVTGGPVAKKSPLRISCRDTGGDMVIKIKPRSKKKTLRSVVGEKLTLGFSSPTGSTQAVPLQIGYDQPR